MFMIAQSTLLEQSAVQNKFSRAKSSLGKFGKISTSGKKPAIRYVFSSHPGQTFAFISSAA